MDHSYHEKLEFLKSRAVALTQSLHGLEKECFRVTADGRISQQMHPAALGSTLMHPFISTDFAEAQLELIAPPFQSASKMLEFMDALHRYIYRKLGDEMLWSFSAPPVLERDVMIARYGSSAFAFEKELYRKGLHYRYGSAMQSLSGVHYNFSFPEELIVELGERSETYLHIVRNYLRFGWLSTYLFGATPVYDETYFDQQPKELEVLAPHTIGGRYATSLRMSQFGYYSRIQTQIGISFNSLDEYIEELNYAVETPNKSWSSIPKGCQINDHIIQIEAEHYSRIRPKPPVTFDLRPIDALKQKGIGYLEVRSLDLDPWSVSGVSAEQIDFLYTFLLYCLLKDSPPLTDGEERKLTLNQNLVALKGRKPDLDLEFNGKSKTLKSWGVQILEEMIPIAKILDQSWDCSSYSSSLERQLEKLDNPEKTPSKQVLDQVLSSSYRDYGTALAQELRSEYLKKPCPKPFEEELDRLAAKSIEEREELEFYDDFVLKGYEDLELSTQALLREAFRRGIEIEELDRAEHFFRLRSGDRVEMVKNATMTSRDSLITYWQMENKVVTKKLLWEHGISVPSGVVCTNYQEALRHYPQLSGQKLIIKPNRMNYGIGIYTVEPDDLPSYEAAVRKAFQHGQEIVVEQFLSGEEYRFLVIDGEVAAVCRRIPANVVGDGVQTIRQLIHQKNSDPKSYKIPKYYLREGDAEADFLAGQGLSFSSIPERGKRIFLLSNSNVSTGGDSIDMTDEVSSEYKQIAVRSAQIVEAAFCGVDIMIQDLQAPPNPQNYGIIELNFNPALWIHRYPTEGAKRYVEKNVLDALGFFETEHSS